MSYYSRKIPVKADCAIEKTLNVITGKWKPAILSELLRREARLRDFEQGLPEATKRTLTRQLGELIDSGLVQKEDFDEYPRKTVYSLTPLGRKLAPVFTEMTRFGQLL